MQKWAFGLLIISNLLTSAEIAAKKSNGVCQDAIFKPKRCGAEANAKIDRHATESWGPHGYNYDGIPYYLDDGYGHQGGGSWW